MNEKKFTVAILGCGSRGREAYGKLFYKFPERWKIVSLCDISEKQLHISANEFKIEEENLFRDENEFFKEKRADLLVIATQDRDHVRQATKALGLGYDILLEKPISGDKKELIDLLELQKKTGRKVMVCHVLRYAPAYAKMAEEIKSGRLGKIISINAVEQVCYWHFSHSFVRGNWRNSEETSPVILQKCCHDMDILQWFAGSKAKTVYSTGSLAYFNKENKPEESSDRCSECKYINDCVYSAENLYVKRWKRENSLEDCWPFNVVCRDIPNTEEKLRKAYTENQYGRCVFSCDNDVCDNQQVVIDFENGVHATLQMVGFSDRMGRKIQVYGTEGFIDYQGTGFNSTLRIDHYGKDEKVYDEEELVKGLGPDGFGHGGGDIMMINALYEVLCGKGDDETSLENSVESHLMSIAAEESRIKGTAMPVHGEKYGK